jgi:hypothetical protein
MLYWNHTPDQSRSCMVSCQNRVEMSGMREMAQAVRGCIARRILEDAACVALMRMWHAEPCLGMVTGGIHLCARSRQERFLTQ